MLVNWNTKLIKYSTRDSHLGSLHNNFIALDQRLRLRGKLRIHKMDVDNGLGEVTTQTSAVW